MTPLRRAGARWRLLVHEYPGNSPVHVDGNEGPSTRHNLHLPNTELDEVVVGRWLHIEQQDTGQWSVHIGGVVIHAAADRDGRPLAVSVHGPGDYADPVPGCAYDLAWTLPDTTPGETPA